MAVTVYKSTDASAPVLSGQAGALVGVLDACLVNGYGAKAAVGWTIAYTGTNLRAYRAPSGAQMYCRVDDASPNATSGAREAQFRGYETMSAISTGTNPFPTVAQVAVSGMTIRKSPTADATARPWIVVADAKTFYLFTDTPDFTGYGGYMFGDYYSLKSGVTDTYRCLIVGRITQGTAIALDTDDNLQNMVWGAIATTALTGHYVPRTPYMDIVVPVTVGKHADGVKGVSTTIATPRIGNGIVAYPNQQDGSVLLSRVWLHDDLGSQMSIRGRMRGFWAWNHPVGSPVNDGDTFSGTGDLAGKTFLVIKPVALGDGMYVMETSDTWETNA